MFLLDSWGVLIVFWMIFERTRPNHSCILFKRCWLALEQNPLKKCPNLPENTIINCHLTADFTISRKTKAPWPILQTLHLLITLTIIIYAYKYINTIIYIHIQMYRKWYKHIHMNLRYPCNNKNSALGIHIQTYLLPNQNVLITCSGPRFTPWGCAEWRDLGWILALWIPYPQWGAEIEVAQIPTGKSNSCRKRRTIYHTSWVICGHLRLTCQNLTMLLLNFACSHILFTHLPSSKLI